MEAPRRPRLRAARVFPRRLEPAPPVRRRGRGPRARSRPLHRRRGHARRRDRRDRPRPRGRPSRAAELSADPADEQVPRAVAIDEAEVVHRVDAVGDRREAPSRRRRVDPGGDRPVAPALLDQADEAIEPRSVASCRRAAAARRRSGGSTRPRSRARAARRTAVSASRLASSSALELLGSGLERRRARRRPTRASRCSAYANALRSSSCRVEK